MSNQIDPYTDAGGQYWDLNDPKTYEGSWFPEDCRSMAAHELRRRIKHEIGVSLYYMICANKSDFGCNSDQYHRVVQFGKHFARESREQDRLRNVAWLRKQLFMILDETENQV